jgi:hypothetical protein
MNEVELLSKIRADLQEAPNVTVIYLEGVTDPEFLFSLLGLKRPTDDVHQGVLVKGLSTRQGSGSGAVRSRVELASRFQIPRIFGVLDGDGRSLSVTAANFDTPYSGPLFHWKAYGVENLIAKTGWPPAWGDAPDWATELAKYGPYVALNRVGLDAQAILKDLNLSSYSKPSHGTPLRRSDEIASALAAGKARLLSFDVEAEFLNELSTFETAVRRDLDEAHTLIDGKWLFRHLAPTLTNRDKALCEYEWLAHARSIGGLPEVRDWWERVTGNPP